MGNDMGLPAKGIQRFGQQVHRAIEAGAFGTHVPHELTWALEAADPPEASPRYARIDDLSGLAALLHRIGG